MADSEVFVDRETGRAHGTARSLVNAYIDRFSERVTEAVGEEIRFKHLDEDGYTFVQRGSATVGINVLDGQGMLLFLARIMAVPRGDELAFFRRLLELNYSATADAAFAVDRQTESAYLRAARSVQGLDYEEFEQLLDTVATVADEWDDKLQEEFGEE